MRSLNLLTFLILAVFVSGLAGQDITARTDDGGKVILHENGTWEWAKQDTTTQVQPQTQIVYVTRTGSKYHRGYCRYLSKSKIPMSLEQAARRYNPCSVCKPPRPRN